MTESNENMNYEKMVTDIVDYVAEGPKVHLTTLVQLQLAPTYETFKLSFIIPTLQLCLKIIRNYIFVFKV